MKSLVGIIVYAAVTFVGSFWLGFFIAKAWGLL